MWADRCTGSEAVCWVCRWQVCTTYAALSTLAPCPRCHRIAFPRVIYLWRILLCEMCRVPTPPGKSWIFFLENSRTWKVLEKHFGPGKSWKLKFKVLESSWSILPPLAFHILLHATVSAMDYTPNVVSKRCLVFIFKHSWAPKRSWKISHGGPGKVLDFFPVKEWEPWMWDLESFQ